MISIPIVGKWVTRKVGSYILTNDFKKKVVAYVNARVDIPKLNEKDEKKLFNAIFDAIAVLLGVRL